MEQLPLRLGRVYLDPGDIGVDSRILSQFTRILRVQMMLVGDRKLRYEIVGVSPKFDEVGVVGMLEELSVAKTASGQAFTGCPWYAILNGEIV